jgi:hypothetical protein
MEAATGTIIGVNCKKYVTHCTDRVTDVKWSEVKWSTSKQQEHKDAWWEHEGVDRPYMRIIITHVDNNWEQYTYIQISTVTTGQLLYVCNILDRFQLHFHHFQVSVGSNHTDSLLEYHDDKRTVVCWRQTHLRVFTLLRTNGKNIKISSTRGCLGLRSGAVASGTWRRVADTETSAASDLLTRRHTPERRPSFTHSCTAIVT